MADREAFVEPTSIGEAEERRLKLVDEIQQIQEQLSDKNREFYGQGTDTQEYNRWRRSAISAWRHKQNVLRHLNLWIKAWNRQQHQEEFDDVGTLLDIIDSPRTEINILDEDDRLTVEEIRKNHRHRGLELARHAQVRQRRELAASQG